MRAGTDVRVRVYVSEQALMQLSPSHYNVFIYMTSFLREVLKSKDKNKLTAKSLGECVCERENVLTCYFVLCVYVYD